jgi:carbon monoxide dehydrogenase subunit G
MKLEQSFTVAAPVEQVWAALIDVERVAPCLPGAEITGHDEEGAYHGTFTVKLGPTTASYNGTLRLDEVDEAAHAVVMSARGTDKRGQGGATATIRSVVAPEGDGTKVEVDTDFTITGRLARFGRGGMIEDVSRRLLADFSSCLQERIVAHQPVAEGDAASGAEAPTPPPPPPAAKPVNGLRLFFQVLADRIRRLLHRRG